MARSYLVVESTVPSEIRERFDNWYRADHLPRVIALLGARRGWRFWAIDDSASHVAVYEFERINDLENSLASSEFADLVREFDEMWTPGVTRTRKALEVVQTVGDHLGADKNRTDS
jgi:hypothetical protein